MNNLWILTEERPKKSVIHEIVKLYANEFDADYKLTQIDIIPRISNNNFQFIYDVEGISINGIDKIYIKTVSGGSSFVDYLIFLQEKQPNEDNTHKDNLIFAIEETKTSDSESRNTGVYQRSSKFVFIDLYYTNVKKYMLYNEELEDRTDKKPSDTSIFGTNMLLTQDVHVVGKDISKYFYKFKTLDDLINFKSGMRKPPEGNVPIDITKYSDRIEISGRLSKPADAGNIGHDPNIGALSAICKTIRCLGWTKDLVITKHGITQAYIDKTKGKNKFLFICRSLNINLAGITLPPAVSLPETYWHYEKSSEKVTTIFLHLISEHNRMRGIYENHAGCERGYFKSITNKLITLPKKDKTGKENLYLPDVIIHNPEYNKIYLVEGKKLETLNKGLIEIENYDSIENEFIKLHYPDCSIERWVTLFGGKNLNIPNEKVLLQITDDGTILLNKNADSYIKNMF